MVQNIFIAFGKLPYVHINFFYHLNSVKRIVIYLAKYANKLPAKSRNAC